MTPRHYIVNEPGDGEVIVSDDSGTRTELEDDICRVYGGNDGDYEKAKVHAARIAALLNLAEGVSTSDLVNGTSILLNTSAALPASETGDAVVYASLLHERYGFSLHTDRPYVP